MRSVTETGQALASRSPVSAPAALGFRAANRLSVGYKRSLNGLHQVVSPLEKFFLMAYSIPGANSHFLAGVKWRTK
jgi:hypothetical protein